MSNANRASELRRLLSGHLDDATTYSLAVEAYRFSVVRRRRNLDDALDSYDAARTKEERAVMAYRLRVSALRSLPLPSKEGRAS